MWRCILSILLILALLSGCEMAVTSKTIEPEQKTVKPPPEPPKESPKTALSKESMHPLLEASYKGDMEKVKHFLQNGSSPNMKDKDGSTPLILASQNGHLAIVDLLISKGADPNAKDGKGGTALHVASVNGHKDVVKTLLENGADSNTKNTQGFTSLHVASIGGHTPVIKLLLEKGADPNAKNEDGYTPLTGAAKRGLIEVAILLLAKGADPNTSDKDGTTPLMYASVNGHQDMAALLLEKKANPNAQDKESATPLHHAAINGHLEVIRLLLDKGADPNAKDKENTTPLMYAAIKGHTEAVKLLLDKGADPNAKDRENTTPLMYAAINGYTDMATLLLSRGANPGVKRSNGITALDIAYHKQHKAIADMLKAAMKKSADFSIPGEELTANTEANEAKVKEFTPKVKDFEPKTKDFEPTPKDFEPKTKDAEPTPKDSEPTPKDFEPESPKSDGGVRESEPRYFKPKVENESRPKNEYEPKTNGEIAAKYYIEWVVYVMKMDVSEPEKAYLIQWAGKQMEQKIDGIQNISKDILEANMKKNYDLAKYADIRENEQKRTAFRKALDTDQVPITITSIEQALANFRSKQDTTKSVTPPISLPKPPSFPGMTTIKPQPRTTPSMNGKTCFWEITVPMYDEAPWPLSRVEVDKTKFRLTGVVDDDLGERVQVTVIDVLHIDNRNNPSEYYQKNIGTCKETTKEHYMNRPITKRKEEVTFK